MQYEFLQTSDEALIEGAKLPLTGGVAVALLTTGYDVERDEAVEISIVDVDGRELFAKKVKPHNLEIWDPCEASGGIGPADVADAQALYEFEDEIMSILEGVEFVLCQHIDFLKAMLDRSWIALPKCVQVDVCEVFRLSHSTAGHSGEPATVATLDGIVDYYGFSADTSTTTGVAHALALSYRSIVGEYVSERDAKGDAYWEAYEQRKAEQSASDNAANSVAQIRERRLNQMNALLWIAGGIIFTSLVIQLYQRGADIGLMIVAGAAAAFAYIRGIINWNKK